eukprot:m.347117 g.347117  ORF g.347117 m.347117 type:complete len:410 (+) comp31343_c0_seq1:257-1486(+)
MGDVVLLWILKVLVIILLTFGLVSFSAFILWHCCCCGLKNRQFAWNGKSEVKLNVKTPMLKKETNPIPETNIYSVMDYPHKLKDAEDPMFHENYFQCYCCKNFKPIHNSTPYYYKTEDNRTPTASTNNPESPNCEGCKKNNEKKFKKQYCDTCKPKDSEACAEHGSTFKNMFIKHHKYVIIISYVCSILAFECAEVALVIKALHDATDTDTNSTKTNTDPEEKTIYAGVAMFILLLALPFVFSWTVHELIIFLFRLRNKEFVCTYCEEAGKQYTSLPDKRLKCKIALRVDLVGQFMLLLGIPILICVIYARIIEQSTRQTRHYDCNLVFLCLDGFVLAFGLFAFVLQLLLHTTPESEAQEEKDVPEPAAVSAYEVNWRMLCQMFSIFSILLFCGTTILKALHLLEIHNC